MRTLSPTIEINEILVLTGSDEITIAGTVKRDLLNYETRIEIQSTQLNRVINELQKNNPEIEISSMFQSRPLASGQSFFYMKGLENINSEIAIETITHSRMIRQIRA